MHTVFNKYVFAKIAQPKADKPAERISQIRVSTIVVLFGFLLVLAEPRDVAVVTDVVAAFSFKLRESQFVYYVRRIFVNKSVERENNNNNNNKRLFANSLLVHQWHSFTIWQCVCVVICCRNLGAY